MTAPAPVDAAPARPPASGNAFARHVRTHPFSVVLSVVVLATGLVFSTFWGSFPEELAAGPLTTGALVHWWTPLTALLIPGSLVQGILTIALLLTVGAYAERLAGTARAVILFFGTGIVAVLLGVGVQALAAAWGSSWGELAQLDLVLDPSIGVVGLVLAAGALAPGLFRRRIRLVGFAVLVMFALYAGDADSVYRLIAGLVGLVAGYVLGRGRAPGAWRRSSYGETRTLVAAIVAVTGLGPLVVLISGAVDAPLGMVVSGFAPVDVDEVFDRCDNAVTPACDTELAVALTTGIGPFLLSLVPLALALIAAWGLCTGRRAAWILALGTNAAIAVLTAVSAGTIGLLEPGVLDIVGGELAFWATAATLVPLAVIVLLGVTWRRFMVAALWRAVVRFLVTVLVALVVLALAYLAIGLLRAGDYLDGADAGRLLADIPRLFLPAGFLTGVPVAAVPVEGLALFAFQWIGPVFWVVFVLAVLQLYRATVSRRNGADEERFRALLRKGGGGTLGFMGTWPGNDYWFTPDGSGAVAYRVIDKVALTMSDPVCTHGAERETIEGFVRFCDSQGWSAVFYSFHERHLPVFESFGWQHMSVGEETVLDLPDLEMTGKPWQKIRQALNKGAREGITTLWSTWDELPASVAAQIDAISEQWVAEKELPEMGFTLGGIQELNDPEVALYLAIGRDGNLQAITSWLPSWTDGEVTGWTIDFMRRGDDSMPGIMEFVIASAALHMKGLGAHVLSLSGAPLAQKPLAPGEEPRAPDVMDRLLGWLAGALEPAYGFTSLFRFKSKFNPRYDTIHMAYADPASLPAIGLAIGRAYLPEVSTREYLALAKTLTRREPTV